MIPNIQTPYQATTDYVDKRSGIPDTSLQAIPMTPIVSPFAEEPSGAPAPVSQLAGYVRSAYNAAKSARQQNGVDSQFMRAKRARALQYEPERLVAIKSLMGNEYDPPYVPVIDTKCRALQAFLTNRYNHGDSVWELEPSPMPDLPAEVEQEVKRIAGETLVTKLVMADPSLLEDRDRLDKEMAGQFEEMVSKVRDMALMQRKRASKAKVDVMSLRTEAALLQGGWYSELKGVWYDFSTFPAAIIKGPIPMHDKIVSIDWDDSVGKHTPGVIDRVIDGWKHVSPVNIYPAPDSKGINDGDLMEVDSFQPSDLYDFIGVKGFNEIAIRKVLKRYQTGGFHEFRNIDSENSDVDRQGITFNNGLGTKIDGVWFWGSVPGSLLLQYGMDASLISDSEKWYQAWVLMIDNEVIMARLNSSRLGKKPYYKACFVENPDSFWGYSIPDLLSGHQNMANAVRRAAGQNIAYASGPVIEVNIDGLADGESRKMTPYRTVETTSKRMAEPGGQIVRYHQHNLVANELSLFERFLMEDADTVTGIPKYQHGGQFSRASDAAARTASGMNMQRQYTDAGLSRVWEEINTGIIKPSVEAQFHSILQYEPDVDLLGNVAVKVKGQEGMDQKAELASKIQDTIDRSANPIDLQIFGMKARQELWREKLKAMKLDDENLLPEDKELINQFTGGAITGQVNDGKGPQPKDFNGMEGMNQLAQVAPE